MPTVFSHAAVGFIAAKGAAEATAPNTRTEAAQFGASPVILDHLGDAFQKRGKTAQARDCGKKPGARINNELAARIREKLNAASK